MPHWLALHGPFPGCLPRIPGRNGPPHTYRPEHGGLNYSSHPSQRATPEGAPPCLSFWAGFSLVNDSGTSRGDDHSSITGPFQFSESIFSSQQSSHSIPSLHRQHHISPLSYQSLSTLNQASYHSRQSSPIVRAKVPPASQSEQEAYREAFEAVEHLPAEQARLSVPIFSDKTPESQKKASSLAHLSYTYLHLL